MNSIEGRGDPYAYTFHNENTYLLPLCPFTCVLIFNVQTVD